MRRISTRVAALSIAVVAASVLPSSVSFGTSHKEIAVRPAPDGFADITHSPRGRIIAEDVAEDAHDRGMRTRAERDDYQVFSRQDGNRELVITASRELKLLSVTESDGPDNSHGLHTKAIITDHQVAEAANRAQERESGSRPSAAQASGVRQGTGTWTDLGCAVLNSKVYHRLSNGDLKVVVEKVGCGVVDKSNATDSDGRYHYGVHFRQEADAYRYWDQDGSPYTTESDYARLDEMFIKAEPYNMNFLWSGSDSRRPGTRNSIQGNCSSPFDLTLTTPYVSVGKSVQFCDYWYPYYNLDAYFYYMQNEWRSESEDMRKVGISFAVKRGGSNRGTYSFLFTNDVYYDLFDNGIQVCNTCKSSG